MIGMIQRSASLSVVLAGMTCSPAGTALSADVPVPRPVDPRLKVELFAAEPELVTPTGIDVDHAGRVWVVESNTHFPPDGYDRHPTDRLWVMEDANGDGKMDKQTLFADGFQHAMSVAVKPVWLPLESLESRLQPDGDARKREPQPAAGTLKRGLQPNGPTVFVATRAGIWLLRDTDGDLKADERTRIVTLETKGNYPHNGLAGFAFDPLGWMYFGLGENFGEPYEIVGSDGSKSSGGGEGGNIYRCRPDGSQLSRWATGFWNPHASCVDAFGRLFTVDNDADSRPPCRLLHIVPGGDYGYRFRNGRKGLHPFTSWNGELPGTLPMVAGTGEAPSGIVAYESDGLPADYLGDLLVTSWGDHRVDRFRLKPRGASFESRAEPIVQGGPDFRPVGIALAPDGSLYASDWVKEDYKLHGHGRVWRISAVEEPQRKVIDAAAIGEKTSKQDLERMLRSPRVDVRRRAAFALGRIGTESLSAIVKDEHESERARLEGILALRQRGNDARLPYQPQLLDRRESEPPSGPRDDLTGAELPFIPLIPLESGLGATEKALREALQPVESRFAFALLHKLRGDYLFLLAYQGPVGIDVSDTRLDPALVAPLIGHDDPFIAAAAVDIAANFLREAGVRELLDPAKQSEQTRMRAVVAARKFDPRKDRLLSSALRDPAPSVRQAAVQWAAEEEFKALRPRVEQAMNGAVTRELFLATLAALEILDGKSPHEFDKTPPVQYLLKYVRANDTPAAVRALALRMIPPAAPELRGDLLAELIRADDAMQLETVRTLHEAPRREAQPALVALAADERAAESLKLEARDAIAAAWRAGIATAEGKRLLLERLAADDDATRIAAARALRGLLAADAEVRQAFAAAAKPAAETAADRPQFAELVWLAAREGGLETPAALAEIERRRPKVKDEWYAHVLDEGGNPEAGRQVFFSSIANCAKCHTIDGRGGQVGPDLSLVARTMDRKKLAESIVEPSREIAPQWVAWSFVMDDGRVHSGAVVTEADERIVLGTSEGTTIEIERTRVEQRVPQKTSIMPEDLVRRLAVAELRDLLAFLEARR
ncbi:MAG: PVC-type heme-binding CxxCH protein [Planctomycetales bacterium]